LKARRKSQIQADLERQLAIKVCQVRPGGGTSNTGNVARRALNAPDVLGNACGIPSELVKLAKTLWILLACPYEVDPEKFQALCDRFKEVFFDPQNNVSWYKLPPTVHKVLFHGAAILRKSPVPVGLLSEECSEANNKCMRRFQEHHARQTSKKNNLSDIFFRLMDKSDPIILSEAAPKLLAKRRPEPLPIEVLECLANPEDRIVSNNESNDNLEESADTVVGAIDGDEIDDEITYD
jgi:hypothetical protein